MYMIPSLSVYLDNEKEIYIYIAKTTKFDLKQKNERQQEKKKK